MSAGDEVQTAPSIDDSIVDGVPDAANPATPDMPEENGGFLPMPELEDKKENSVTSGKKIIGIRLPDSYMVYRVAANFPELEADDSILLQTKNGETVGRVAYISNSPPQKSIDQSLLFPGNITRIVKKLGKKDLQAFEKKHEIEQNAKIVCRKLIRELKLAMKLAKVTYLQKGGKILFHFTSEGRIDFRELVRQLGSKLKSRIEMRHVGVRDETRLLSGIGPCGKELCCSQYLQKFHPVSVRMAKNQDLSLNPDGISGVCGRLLCCLAYENDIYVELKKGLPKVKKCCFTQNGQEATVKCVHTLSGKVTIQYKDGVYATVPAETLSREKPPPQTPAPQQEMSGVEYHDNGAKPTDNKNLKSKGPSSSKDVVAGSDGVPDSKPSNQDNEQAAKIERRKKSRRRRRRRGKSGEKRDGQQPDKAASSGRSQQKAKASEFEPKGESGKSKDGSGAEKSGGKSRRRRRRRRRGGNNKEGGSSASAAAPARE